jgi:chromosomal replication initiator protein
MIPEHELLEFAKKLFEVFLALGYPEKTVQTLTKVVTPQTFAGNTLVLKCDVSFYAMILDDKHKEIERIVKSVWGAHTQFIMEKDSGKTGTSRQKAAKNASQIPKNTPSIFDFEGTPSMPKQAPLLQTLVPLKNERPDHSDFGLSPEYTFSSFVRGPSNSIAYSACESVSFQPGRLSNPVFIYGGSGLGKTHLLHAVGNEILSKHPSWKVLYLPSSDFVNGFVQAIRHGQGNSFRGRFLECDLLLIDDVQFLENKEQTQLEFFHIFNLLCQKRKQVILTSDKYPKDIPTLEERLRSRFLQGLLADIEPPSFEERLAIIESTAEQISLRLSPEVASMVATNVKTNIRELKGTLNNLLLRQTVSGIPPSVHDVETVLRSIVKVQRQTITIAAIQKMVAGFYDIKVNDLTSSSKAQKLVFPRHVAMYLSRELLSANLVEIANEFGRKDHTTVLNACDNVKKKMETDASTRSSILEIKRRLEQIG